MLRQALAAQDGRTLVEVIVATAASLVVLLAVTALMATALRWNREDQMVLDRQRAVRNAADRIARDVRQAGDVRWDGALHVTRGGQTHSYRVRDGRLELIRPDGTVSLVLQPVTGMSARVEPWTDIVHLTLESVSPDGTGFSVYQQITPRVVVP